MKIAFVPSGVSGVAWYRAYQPAIALRDLGVKTALLWYRNDLILPHPWEDEIGGDNSILADLHKAYQWADAVVWMQLHTTKALDAFLTLKEYYKKPSYIELDDYVFNVPTGNIASRVYWPGGPYTQIVLEQIKAATGLIVSTPHLRDLYLPLNSNIAVIENTIDLNLWARPSPRARSFKHINIGWVGGGSHMEDLKMIEKPLFDVLALNRFYRFTCLHGCPPEWRSHPQVVCPLEERDGRMVPSFRNINEYPLWVRHYRFDIGIAPLVDNEFNRAKSNLRWLEYSAQSIPTVYSPVTHFAQTIKPGVTGIPASTDEEWGRALTKLIDDKVYRKKMGDAAAAEIKRRWQPRHQAMKYKEFFKKELQNAGINPQYVSNANS